MIIREAKIVYNEVGEIEAEKLDDPEKIVAYMKGAFDEYPEQESFWVIGLDQKNKLKFRQMVTLGGISQCLIDVRLIFKPLLMASCSAFVVCHNHPSGETNPSSADIKITREIKEAAKIMKMEFLDHIIIGDDFYSFQNSVMF